MKLNISFKETNNKFKINLDESTVIVPLVFSEKQVIIKSETEPYTGDYSINPTFDPQVLDTAGKRMTSDLTINEIKVSSVSNPFGGRTVFIGG